MDKVFRQTAMNLNLFPNRAPIDNAKPKETLKFSFSPSSTDLVTTTTPSSHTNIFAESAGFFSNKGYELWKFPKPVSPPESPIISSPSSPQRSPSPAPALKLLQAPPSPPKLFPAAVSSPEPTPETSPSQASPAPTSTTLFPAPASPWPVASKPPSIAQVDLPPPPPVRVIPAQTPASQASPAPAPPSKLFAAPESSSQASPAPATPSREFIPQAPLLKVFPTATSPSQASPVADPTPRASPATAPHLKLVPVQAPSEAPSAPAPSTKLFPASAASQESPAPTSPPKIFTTPKPTSQASPAPASATEPVSAPAPTEASPAPAPPKKLVPAPAPAPVPSQVSPAPAPSSQLLPATAVSKASSAPAPPSRLFAAPAPPSKLFSAPPPSAPASSAPAPPSQLFPDTAPGSQFVLASAPPKKVETFKFDMPKGGFFSTMSPNRLNLSDSSSNSVGSSPQAAPETEVQTPATVVSEPDETTLDTSLESMFLTVKTQQDDEIKTSPLLTLPPLKTAPPSHYGLLGVDSRAINKAKTAPCAEDEKEASATPSLSNSRIFHNVAAPSSTFICGSQGSGKSNTLACLLENCLLPNKYGVLPKPLTGIVFHYDGFNSDAGGLICEAACLASDKRIRVRVICAPTNIKTIRHTYRNVPGVIIEPLQLRDSHLNTSRMLDLMAVGETNVPLYMRVVGRVLRELRLEQQQNGGTFNYEKFKSKMLREDLTDMQRAPLNQRLDTLESFMVQTGKPKHKINKYAPVTNGNDWTPKAGQLTIVDLSCPCVTAEMACSLFNICLHLFVEGTSPIGRVIALDEAHKYMTMGPESRTLTDNLLGVIRLQRHLGARIIISTQEPTISPKLLDLCSVTIVHRFTSPDWLRTLQGHLAGVSYMSAGSDESGAPVDEAELYRGAVKPLALGGKNAVMDLFAKIVSLRTGEALVFSPSAIIDLRNGGDAQADDVNTKALVVRLAHRALRVQVRTRLTLDGGRSVMAA